MRRFGIIGVLMLGFSGPIIACGQGETDDEAIPEIQSVAYWIQRYIGASDYRYDPYAYLEDLWDVPMAFDPEAELAREYDYMIVQFVVYDTDLLDEDSEEFFIQERGYARSIGPPAPPPLEDLSNAYTAANVRYLGGANVLITFQFQIPDYQGVNQARLRGQIDYDVAWSIRVRISNDSNESSDPSQGNKWAEWWFDLYASEQYALRGPNPPPFADAGSANTVIAGSTVVLDGRQTWDSSNTGFSALNPNVLDKDQLTYVWEWISGPVRVDPVPNDDNEPATSQVTLDVVGTYVYRLLVYDPENSVPSASLVTIEVRASLPVNRAPVAVATGPGGPVQAGAVIELDGSGSWDPDGDQLLYRWRQTNELGGNLDADEVAKAFQPISGLETAVSQWRAMSPGTFHFRLLVTDRPELQDAVLAGSQLGDIASITVQVQGATAGADQAALKTDAAADEAADLGAVSPLLPAACGAGLLPVTLAPLVLLFMRGRWR